MKVNANDLKELVKIGGSISIDASSITITELKDIIHVANQNTTIIIRNAIHISIFELKEIVRKAGCKVISEF